nr:expressed protein [Hymenolepis microstoma]
MCVFCLERECKADCVQKFDERLNSIYERLLNSFASTKQVIDVEVMKQSRMMCARRNSLIHKLETQFKQDVQFVQRLIGLLEYAKSRNNSERNGLIAYIESQLNSIFGKNNGNFSFNCNSAHLADAIHCFGQIERNAVEMSSLSQYLFADKPLPTWLHKHQNLIGNAQDIEIQSLSSELESFEILDCTPTTSRTCSFCVCEKMDKAPMVACKQCENQAAVPSGSCNLFPSILKDMNAWLPKPSKSFKLENSEKKDLEEKLEYSGIKQENDKPSKDIESPIRVAESSCKSAVGDPVCKFFGNCTFQGLNEDTTIPIKPCVKAWLKSQGFEGGEESGSVSFRGVESSDIINHLRKIGATDTAMWLSGKRSNAMASGELSERTLMPTNQSRGDNLGEMWLRDWCEQDGSSPNVGEMDIQAAKRSKLANFLLDSQQNFEADLEAILYRSPFAVRTNANWLQPANNNRKATGAVRWRLPILRIIQPSRSWFSTKSSFPSNTVLVAPLTEECGITLPPGLLSSQYDLKFVSRFKIPNINKKSIKRRVEYNDQMQAIQHSLNVRRNRLNQQLLYRFAFSSCLNLNSENSSSALILDLGCGSLLPFGGENIISKGAFKLGLDQLISPQVELNFIQCSLVNSRLALRESSIDYLVSISFLQWITASDDRGLVDLFSRECIRVLSNYNSAGVLQFYPANEDDLDMVCESLANLRDALTRPSAHEIYLLILERVVHSSVVRGFITF